MPGEPVLPPPSNGGEPPQSYEELVASGLMAPDPMVELAINRTAGMPLAAPPPTSAADWRSARKKGFTVTLPSGQAALVRRTLDLFARLEREEIPNPLAGIVTKLIQGEPVEMSEESIGQEGMAQMLTEMNNTIVAMMIVPEVMHVPEDAPWDWEPPEGKISTADVDLMDKVFLYNVAQGGTADLAKFRKDAKAFLEPLPDGTGIQMQAQRPSSN